MKKLYIFMGFVAASYTLAQEQRVGINTSSPSATLTVKSKTGTDANTKNLELENANGVKMLTVLNNGNMGIGTTTPTQKLDVNGNARVRQMVDATALESTYTKAVVADPNGNLAIVSRTNPSLPFATQTIFGKKIATDIMLGQNFYQIQSNLSFRGNYYRYSGQYITLPPGKWIVYCGYIASPSSGMLSSFLESNNTIRTQNVWLRAIISDSNTNGTIAPSSIVDGPSLISTNLQAGNAFTFANGLWLVDNNNTTDKTFYVMISIDPTGFKNTDNTNIILNPMSGYSEDYLVAIRRL